MLLSVLYNVRFLPDIILLTLCCYIYRGGIRLNPMKSFRPYSLLAMFPIKRSDNVDNFLP